MKYKKRIETTVKRLWVIFTVLAFAMSVITGCAVIDSESVSVNISKPSISFDMPSVPSALSESENSAASETDDTIPEEWKNHIYLETKNKGFCKNLDGKILIDFVFVSDAESVWDDETRKKAENELISEIQKLEAEASEFGAKPNLYYISTDVSLDIKADRDNTEEWTEKAMSVLGYSSLRWAQLALEASDGYDCAPIVFVLNKSGRSFANQVISSETGSETVVLYVDETSAFRHELLHLFGARDFYYPIEVENAADRYLKNSIMNDSDEGVVDDLTAFLIGWTDELSSNSVSFLEATKNLTKNYISAERDKDRFTGYGTKTFGDGTYTGDMVVGVPQGEGAYTWDNGDYYIGSWENGIRTGKGKFIWVNGDVYEGDFVEGERTGKGKLVFSNGDVYEGDFVNGERIGKGIYRWSNGNSYEGDFIDDERTGKGVYITADGNIYEGDFEKGMFDGKGKYTWSNGDSYEGDFIDNVRTGKGIYTWSNGDVYEGGFKDNKFDGYGIWRGANGNVIDGEWSNGEFIG